MDCQWHNVYRRILQIVQDEVKNVYGPKITLHAKDAFDCNKCLKKSFINVNK